LFCYITLFSRDTPKAKASVCLTGHWAYDHAEEVTSAQNCAFLGCYAAISGRSLPTFRNMSVPFLGVPCRRFGTTCPISEGHLKMGPAVCPETSVRNYHHSLRKNPEECGSQLLLGGSLEACKVCTAWYSTSAFFCLLTFRNRAPYIKDGHAPLPSRCCILYIFFQQT
jgi:hypothetical protein